MPIIRPKAASLKEAAATAPAGIFSDVDPVRSRIMSAIRSKDTGPEMAVRRLVHAMGFRYRLHDRRLPGRPDLSFPRLRKAVFVNGCFWHGHDGCPKARIPATRTEWWAAKIARNAERDREALEALAGMGWDSLTVWECGLRDAEALASTLNRFLRIPAGGPPRFLNNVDFPGAGGRFAASHERGHAAEAPRGAKYPPEVLTMPTRKRREAAKARAAAAAAAAANGVAPEPAKAAAPKAASKPTAKAKAAAPKTVSPKPAAKSAAKPASKPASAKPSKAAAPDPVPAKSLPSHFSASSDMGKGTVTVSRGAKKATVKMSSFSSVAEALAVLVPEEGSALAPEATLTLVDEFSGRKAKVTAAAAADVMAVIAAFTSLPNAKPKAPKAASPAKTPASAKAAPAAASATTEATTAPATPKAAPKTAPKAAPKAAAAKPKPAAKAKPAKKAAKAAPKPTASKAAPKTAPGEMPSWLASMEPRVVTGNDDFVLERTQIALDPASKSTVLGKFGSADGEPAWGYEVTSGGQHVAWVIAEGPKSLILTGALDITASKHSIMTGVVARLTASILPRLKEARAAA